MPPLLPTLLLGQKKVRKGLSDIFRGTASNSTPASSTNNAPIPIKSSVANQTPANKNLFPNYSVGQSVANPPTVNRPAGDTMQKNTTNNTNNNSVFTQQKTDNAQTEQIPTQWINPKTGGLYTPEEYANNVASSLPGNNGDVPKFAGDTLTQGQQTTEQLQGAASGLNNARNDIAVGETDPYKIGSESGIAYSPQELAAIEKAYSGVYDPAINSALSKLDQKQKADEAANQPYTLGKDQVRYDGQGNIIAGNISSENSDSSSGAMEWAKAINNGSAKLSDVPQEIRTSVVSQLGNVSNGTTTPQQQRAINQANVALTAFDDILNNPALERGAVNRIIGGRIPGSNSSDLKESIATVQALIGFEELQKMRDASPTGGALGQVSEREIDFLQQLQGSLKLRQSDDQLLKNIEDIKKSFEILKLVNSPDGTEGLIDEIPFVKSGDSLMYTSPEGDQYERLPDGNLQKVSFNSVGNTKASTLSQAISSQESNNDYSAVNKDSGALGKYQIMPATLKGLGYNVTSQQFLRDQNLQEEAHSKLISELSTRYNGNVDKILADYYGGPKAARIVGTPEGNVGQDGYPSINQYVTQVKKRLNVT